MDIIYSFCLVYRYILEGIDFSINFYKFFYGYFYIQIDIFFLCYFLEIYIYYIHKLVG